MNLDCSVFSDVSGAISIESTTSSLVVLRCLFNHCYLFGDRNGGAISFCALGSLTINDTIGIDCKCDRLGCFLYTNYTESSNTQNVVVMRSYISECTYIEYLYGHLIHIENYQTNIKNLNCSNNKLFYEPGFTIISKTKKASVLYSIFDKLEVTRFVILSFGLETEVALFDKCTVTRCIEPLNIVSYNPGMIHSSGQLLITNCNFALNTCKWLFTTKDNGKVSISKSYILHSTSLARGAVSISSTLLSSLDITILRPNSQYKTGYPLIANKLMFPIFVLLAKS